MALYGREYFEDGVISNYKGYLDSDVFADRARKLGVTGAQRILDVGCAMGFMVGHLRRLGIDAYGCDMSEYAISKAEPHVRPFLMHCDIANGLPYRDKWFDLVCSFDVMEHVPEDQLPAVVAELLRVGTTQFHEITCEEHQIGVDLTHVTIKPLVWWQDRFPELNPVMSL